MVVVKIAEVHIKELLHDWEDERYLSPNRKQVSERWAGGSVALEASMPRSLWSVEEEVQLSLFVRNTSKKPVSRRTSQTSRSLT